MGSSAYGLGGQIPWFEIPTTREPELTDFDHFWPRGLHRGLGGRPPPPYVTPWVKVVLHANFGVGGTYGAAARAGYLSEAVAASSDLRGRI